MSSHRRVSGWKAPALATTCLVFAAALAGCGGDGSAASGDEYSFAMGASSVQGAFYEEAMARNDEANGYDGKWVELSGSEVAVSGVASNKFQFGAGVTSTVMVAQLEQDAPLTFIADPIGTMWTVTGKSEIEDCEDLDGVRFGLHSPGGVSTALFDSWMDEHCPSGVKPEIVYVEGSPNRYQGLLSDQLDATMLEIDDTTDLPDRLHVIANLGEEMSDVETNTLYANETFLEEHPEIAEGLISASSDLAAEINDDSSVFAKIIKERRPELAEKADAIAKAWVDAGAFDPSGGMTMAGLQKTIDTYVDAEAMESGLKAKEIADRSYLESAVK